TSTPSSRRIPRPRPEAFSEGSSEATTTRRRPACRIASVQGGVLPSWQQGSIETYSVASLRSSPEQAAIASTSACGPPYSRRQRAVVGDRPGHGARVCEGAPRLRRAADDPAVAVALVEGQQRR